jgi:hypothetical protein
MKEILSNKLGHFGKPPLTPLILILSKDWHVKRVRGGRDTKDNQSCFPPRKTTVFCFQYLELN